MMMDGTIYSAEFITDEDDDEREPGTYITIRLDANERIGAGRVRVEYIEGG